MDGYLNCPKFKIAFTDEPIPKALLGVMGATEAGKGYVNTENNQMAYIGAIFTSSYHTKQLNPLTN